MSILTTARIVMTRGAEKTFKNAQIQAALQRFDNQDWGATCAEDSKMNDKAVKSGNRILAVYEFDGETMWIIRDPIGPGHEVVTVLLPDEY